MATRILQAQPFNFDINPTILSPTAGDLEEARIRRLMDTAKLQNLQLEPMQNERMFNLQKAQLGETSTYHQAQIADMASGRTLEARGQDVQMRGQDLTMDAHKDAIKSATMNNILSHAIARPDIPLSVYADTAKQFGFPELGVALAGHHDELQTEKAKQLATNLKVAATSGDTKTYNEQLTTLRAMPDFNELAPKIKASVPEYAKDLDPTTPGVQTTNPLGGYYTDIPRQGPTIPIQGPTKGGAPLRGPDLGSVPMFVSEPTQKVPSPITFRNSPYANDPEFQALNAQFAPQAEAERLRQEQATKDAAIRARAVALQRRKNELRGVTPGYGRSYEGLK